MTTTTTLHHLPTPSKSHATCAWCDAEFATIVSLLEHVDRSHVDLDSPRGGDHALPHAA